jgi:hypothetical protein
MNKKQTEESNMASNMTCNNANGIIIMMVHLLAIVSGQQGLPCFHKSILRNARGVMSHIVNRWHCDTEVNKRISDSYRTLQAQKYAQAKVRKKTSVTEIFFHCESCTDPSRLHTICAIWAEPGYAASCIYVQCCGQHSDVAVYWCAHMRTKKNGGTFTEQWLGCIVNKAALYIIKR